MGRRRQLSDIEEKKIIVYLQQNGLEKTLHHFKINRMMLHRIKQRHPAPNNFQKQMWALQKQIFHCKYLDPLNQDNCFKDIPKDILESKRCPDSIYVGKNYGSPNFIKILFVGNNPNIDFQDFGSLGSINEGLKQDLTEIESDRFYSTYFIGVDSPKFYGIQEFPLYNKENWSIKQILAYLFPKNKKMLNGFAYTNGVLCMGSRENGAPSPTMRSNCIVKSNWLRKTLDILKPDLIFIFSIAQQASTWSWWTSEKGVVDSLEELDPVTEFAFYSKFKEDGAPNKTRKTLTIGIPHLTAPRFHTWKSNIPIIYRGLFNLDDNKIISTILAQIKTLIEQKSESQEEHQFRTLWKRFYVNYENSQPTNFKLRNITSKDGFKSISLSGDKRLTIDLHIGFDKADNNKPHFFIQLNSSLDTDEFGMLMIKFEKKYKIIIQNKFPNENVVYFENDEFKSGKLSKTYNILGKKRNITKEDFLNSPIRQDKLFSWGIKALDLIYLDLLDFTNKELIPQ